MGIRQGHARATTHTTVTPRDLTIEMIGTFVLVLVGTLALAQYGTATPAAVIIVAFAFGLGMAAGFSAVGPERFRWINPALTLAAALDGRIRARDLVSSTAAQVVGAILASLVLGAILGFDAVPATVTTAPHLGAALATEIVLSAILALVYLHSTDDFEHLAAARVAVVLTYTGIHLAALPISGASVNPARSIGPAVVALDFTNLWIYVVAPVIGATVAAAIFRVVAHD